MEPESFYHIYNRGNNSETIFYTRENFLYFLKKFRKHIHRQINVLAYCLMPNHFHFLVRTMEEFDDKAFKGQFKTLLSSYTRAINLQEKRIGSLFQQNTKFKELDSNDVLYPVTCFHYIHQNPLKAGLVKKMEDWEFSSYQDYRGLRNGSFCNRSVATLYLDLPESPEEFERQSEMIINADLLHRIR